jgi:hypothetical protein
MSAPKRLREHDTACSKMQELSAGKIRSARPVLLPRSTTPFWAPRAFFFCHRLARWICRVGIRAKAFVHHG